MPGVHLPCWGPSRADPRELQLPRPGVKHTKINHQEQITFWMVQGVRQIITWATKAFQDYTRLVYLGEKVEKRERLG